MNNKGEYKMQLNIFGTTIGGLASGPLSGATVSITGPTNWSGTTNASGYAKDTGGNSPSLKYGSYTVNASLTGYTSASSNFTVPGTTTVSLTLVPLVATVEVIVSE